MLVRGITRKVDELGRVVIPIEMRRALEIGEKDPMEIEARGTEIVLRKAMDRCVFCGESEDLRFAYRDKPVCGRCWNELQGDVLAALAKAG